MPQKRHANRVTITPSGAYQCHECGIRFDWAPGPGKRPRYCSDTCANSTLTQCWQCGTACLVSRSTVDTRPPSCSYPCAMLLRGGMPLPDEHWARWYGKSSGWTAPREPSRTPRFVSAECAECGTAFIGDRQAGYNTGRTQGSVYCSTRCSRRVSKRKRRAREHGAIGSFHWTDVIRIWMADQRRCAYCRATMDEQPDPDHVVPLSRGGANDIANSLACCRSCNCDKGDMTLDEWDVDRERRNLPPVAFDPSQHRHLVIRPAIGHAYRHRAA